MFYGSRTEAVIYHADLDGNNAELMVSGYDFSACEIYEGTVYFTTYTDGTVMTMDEDGGSLTVLYSFSGSVALRDLVIVKGTHIYITDSKKDKVYRITMDGSAGVTLLTSITQPTGIDFSETIDSLIIASNVEEEILTYSLSSDDLAVIYSGEEYKSIQLCGEPCTLLGSQALGDD